MLNRKFVYTLLSILMVASMLLSASGQTAQAQQPDQPTDTSDFHYGKGKPTHADRVAAADRYKALTQHIPGQVCSTPLIGNFPDYFGCYPNFANSPQPQFDANGNVIPGTGIRKFVDSLAGITAAGANNLGNYVSIAVPDKTTYPGSDYYEIAVIEFYHTFNSDLPPTRVRGYVQLETAVVQNAATHVALNYLTGGPVAGSAIEGQPILYNNVQAYALEEPMYLGATIVAQKDRPVRIKFVNLLPFGPADALTGIRPGDLFIPTDKSIMGTGTGPLGGTEEYTQNRETLHLHGGRTPWISDGTPHQWVAPAGETTSYPQGVSTFNVPDMPDPGPGAMTFFYSNQQSARLMFYHDHAYGITRLNVYAGAAAGYLVQDQTEAELVNGGIIPADIIPLVIQDKTFVPTDAELAYEDPTWDKALWGSYGSLWFPHIYVPIQNPIDPSGWNAMGRWHYGPWFWPIFATTHNPIPNPYAGIPGQPDLAPGTPLPSTTPESFMDTPVVNGVVYPYVNLEPRAYRFRILNAANDRFFNLSFFRAASNAQMWSDYGVNTATPTTSTLLDAMAGEVPMVPAVKPATGLWPDYWPVDGRDGGVPDPNYAGPDWVVIGTEGGFLPKPAVVPAAPIDYVYDRGTITVLNVDTHSLFVGPAERVDVVVDFSKFAGTTLIMYNDAPAPVPAGDPRYDTYTGNTDFTYATGDGTGGPASTVAGYGPNIRTVMQVRVAPLDPANTGVSSVVVNNPGSDYTAPVVSFESVDGNGSGAAAQAFGQLDHIALTSPGSGYTSVPTITIDAPTVISGVVGVQATAVATIKFGRLTGLRITNPGSGYLFAPTVTINGGGATVASTATATLELTDIQVLAAGSGYTTAPEVFIDDVAGIGNGALALAHMTPATAPYDMAALDAAFTSDVNGLGVFARSQDPIIVPDTYFNSVYSKTLDADPFVRIQYTRTTFTNLNGVSLTMNMEPKALHELFDPEYGRMNSLLALERPNSNNLIQTTLPFFYIDPVTEIINDSGEAGVVTGSDGTQIWKLTHNGVDTHAIHFHLYDVQIVNRVGWDGQIRPPEPYEAGWKDTVRMNPLEDTIIALRAVAPKLPFGLPTSMRALDVTKPLGSTMGFSNFDINGNPLTVINQIVSFGWEYVWHCHLLGHEENDMMRPVKFNYTAALPPAFTLNVVTASGGTSTAPRLWLAWTDPTAVAAPTTNGNPANEIGFEIQRCPGSTCTNYTTIARVPANATQYFDYAVGSSASASSLLYYRYRVVAYNAAGSTISTARTQYTTVGIKPASPNNFAPTILQAPVRVGLSWTNVTMTGKSVKYALTRTPAWTVDPACDGGVGGYVGGVCYLNPGRTSFIDIGVVAGTKYNYSLTAINTTDGDFQGTPSTTTATPTTTPTAPSNLQAPNGLRTNTSVTLTWNNNQLNPVIGGFQVYRSPNGSTGWTLVGTVQGPVTTYTDTGRNPNTAYWYRVRAFTTGTPSVFSGYTPALPGLRVVTLP